MRGNFHVRFGKEVVDPKNSDILYLVHFILEIASSKYTFAGNFAYWLGTISVSFTTFYSYRLLFLTFLNRTNSYKQFMAHAHEANIILGLPLALLAIGSLFIGYITKDMIVGLGSSFWGNSIFVLSKNISYLEAEYLPYHIKLIPFIFSHVGIFVAYHTTSFSTNSSSSTDIFSFWNNSRSLQKNAMLHEIVTLKPIVGTITFFNQKWHFDDLYNRFFVQKVLSFGYHISFRLFDAGWIAFLGPYGISKTVTNWSRKFGKLQSGFVYHYAFIILTAVTLLLTLLAFSFSFHFGDSFFMFSLQYDYAPSALFFIFILTFYFVSKK